MLCRELDNISLVYLREGLVPHNESIGTVPDCGGEGRCQILRLPHVEKLGLHIQSSSRLLDLLPLKRYGWIAHIEEARDSRGFWNQRFEDLDALRKCLRNHRA